MSEHQVIHPIATMSRLLEVSASGYYGWLKREPSARAISDATLLERIQAIHQKSRGTYGVPRVHAELTAEGTQVGRQRVARLMRQAGLAGASRRKGCWTTIRDRDARPAPDLVQREFVAQGPDRLWVADINLRSDLGRVPVPGGSTRRIQSAHRRLGNDESSSYRAGARGAEHGGGASSSHR